eukprot:2318091-Prymnesium_polylepis.2
MGPHRTTTRTRTAPTGSQNSTHARPWCQERPTTTNSGRARRSDIQRKLFSRAGFKESVHGGRHRCMGRGAARRVQRPQRPRRDGQVKETPSELNTARLDGSLVSILSQYARGDFRYKRSKLALPTMTPKQNATSPTLVGRRRSADPGSWEVVRPPRSLSKHAVPLLLCSDPDSSNRNILNWQRTQEEIFPNFVQPA